MAIDYGTKRTGIAVTDPLKIIATGLTTVETKELLPFIEKYARREAVDTIVIGIPRHLNNTDAAIVPEIESFITKMQAALPDIKLERVDERFTSLIATRSMIESGQSRKTRRDKGVIDKISATIILQSWLEAQQR